MIDPQLDRLLGEMAIQWDYNRFVNVLHLNKDTQIHCVRSTWGCYMSMQDAFVLAMWRLKRNAQISSNAITIAKLVNDFIKRTVNPAFICGDYVLWGTIDHNKLYSEIVDHEKQQIAAHVLVKLSEINNKR